MANIRWECYPQVACSETARAWLQLQANLQLRPKTIDAYGRSLNDYLAFCSGQNVVPETLTREHIGLYVQDLTSRPNPRGSNVLSFESRMGLAHSTLQQRLTVARLYHDYLVEKQLRSDNPVGRGYYAPGRVGRGSQQRGLIASQRKLPWIPSDSEWQNVLHALKEERLRNQTMMLIAYDGALRREELVTLEINDFDFAHRQIRIQAEHAKNGRERIVGFSTVTSHFLEAYLPHGRSLSPKGGPLFLSESHHNTAGPLSLVMWSKVVQTIAKRAGLPRFTTHTPRHLRLTHLARARMDLYQIATYAGHKSLTTTMLYIHLSGVELTEAVSRSLAGFERWIETILEEAAQ